MVLRIVRSLLLAAVLGGVSAAQAQDQVARGKYLAILGDCAGCHSTPHGAPFTGGLPFSAPFGTLYSTNITQDKATGLGNWSEQDFTRALRDGVAPGGKHLYPAFPYIYFTRLRQGDIDALWAYLKTLKPVYAPPRPDQLLFPFNIRAVMIFWNWLYLDKTPLTPEPHRGDAWNRGNYIVNGLGHCAACHTPKDAMFSDETDKALTGAVLEDWFSANLTGNRQDGLGSWTMSDVTQYLATGRNRYATAAGSMQEKVTSSTSHMTDADRSAIAAYLKSLAAHPLAARQTPDPGQMRRGEAVFVARCSECHQPTGQPDQPTPGKLADYPKLAGDTLVMGRDPTTVTRIILEGAESPVTPNQATTYSMPSFAAMEDGDIADVATYIRNAWGNNAPSISKDGVGKLRAAIAASPN